VVKRIVVASALACGLVIACNAIVGLEQPAERAPDGDAAPPDEYVVPYDAPTVSPCHESWTTCAGICVDLLSSPDHCGMCRHSCAGATCNNGMCAPGVVSSRTFRGVVSGKPVVAFDDTTVVYVDPNAAPYPPIYTSDAGPIDSVFSFANHVLVAGGGTIVDPTAPSALGVIATDAGGSLSVTYVNSGVAWVSGDPDASAVWRTNYVDAGTAVVPIAPIEAGAGACALQVGPTGLYWLSAYGTTWANTTLGPDAGVPVTTLTGSRDFALTSWSGESVIALGDGSGDIIATKPGGTPSRVILRGAHATALVSEGQWVYYTTPDSVNRVESSSGIVLTLAIGPTIGDGRCDATHIAIDDKYVYWIDGRTGAIKYVGK
jgi:hypothetical protein